MILTEDCEASNWPHMYPSIKRQEFDSSRSLFHGAYNGLFSTAGTPAWTSILNKTTHVGLSTHVSPYGYPNQAVVATATLKMQSENQFFGQITISMLHFKPTEPMRGSSFPDSEKPTYLRVVDALRVYCLSIIVIAKRTLLKWRKQIIIVQVTVFKKKRQIDPVFGEVCKRSA